jgi:SHS2 domain-containing protein
MTMYQESGYREVEHTADWELEVWAPDFTGLLKQAAQGMNELAGARLKESPRYRRELFIQGWDEESLLVKFLSELLYLVESENLAFDRYELTHSSGRVEAQIEGAPIASLAKVIKAVTYHNLKIRRSKDGLRANLVFDV